MAMIGRAHALQRVIIVCSALGILVVGVVVAFASIYPLYRQLKKVEERHLLLALSAKTAAVEEYLSRAKEVASQIASRTAAREMLENYNRRQVSLETLAEFTAHAVSDAIQHSHEIWGFSRLDLHGNPVFQTGLEFPAGMRALVDKDLREPALHGPIFMGRNSYLVVISPVADRKGVRVGTDLLLFRLSLLERIVEDNTGLGKTGETVLAAVEDSRPLLVFPLREARSVYRPTLPKDSPVRLALAKTAHKQSGILIPGRDYDGSEVITYGPIQGSDWGIVVKMDQRELYAPVRTQIVATASIIVVLLLLGTLGMVLLVRPLTGKLILHTDELEHEVQEKTASLQKELQEREKMERWLMDSERRYRLLLEEVPDVIFMLDNEGRFAYVNLSAERFLGSPVKDILDTSLKDLVVPEDRPKMDGLFRLAFESIWDEEVGVRAADGTTKFARIRCKGSYESDESGLRYEGVMRDITRRKRLEQELKSSREELLEKIKIIDDLYEHMVESGKSKAIADHTAEVAHELRQPLAIIGGFARRMARQLANLPPPNEDTQRDSCRIIVSEIERLERILDNLIDFTRREHLLLEKADPNDIIEQVAKVYQDRIREKNLKLQMNLGSEAGEILLDRDRFEQVMRNLISNAIEASPSGEVINIQTAAFIPSGKAHETGGLEAETYFEVKISNFGVVIPPEDRQKIFSPFYTTKDYGTGIGLTISKKILEDHKGSISVKSEGNGTVFTVWLPMQPASEDMIQSILPRNTE